MIHFRHALQTLLNALWHFFKSVARSFTARRISLWFALVGLVVALLVTLVWLAGRYEASQYQAELDRDTVDAVSDIRRSLTHHSLSLQSLNAKTLGSKYWRAEIQSLMSQNREWLRAERRDLQSQVGDAVNSPFREPIFDGATRLHEQAEIIQTCVRAKRLNGPAYSRTYFVPQSNGIGFEVMEMCLPIIEHGTPVGYTVLTYSLQEILASQLGETYGRRNEISFVEPDGTRLAVHATDGLARQHLGPADGWATCWPRSLSQRFARLGHGHVYRLGLCAGVVGERFASPLESGTRFGRGLGFSKGHGRLFGHRFACS